MVKITIERDFEILTTVTLKASGEYIIPTKLKITYDGTVMGSPVKIFLITREKGEKEFKEIQIAESKEYE